VFTHRSASKVKAHISSTMKAHLIRGAGYPLLLLAVCVTPFALGERSANNSDVDIAKMPAAVGVSSTSGAPQTRGSISPPPESTPITLWNQYNHAGAAVTLSATFFDSPALNSDLADDFTVPAGQSWWVRGIDVDGAYFKGSGPANSFNVFFYYDNECVKGVALMLHTRLKA